MRTNSDFRIQPTPPEAGFEWEELPSLTGVVLRRHVPQGSYALAADLVDQAHDRLRSAPSVAPVWVDTRPAALDPLIPSPPLTETHIDGLATREIIEPDLFKAFFGR